MTLTPDQERMLKAVVASGAYASPEEAPGCGGSAPNDCSVTGVLEQEALRDALHEGLATPEISSEQFWQFVDRETATLLTAVRPGNQD